MSSWLRFVRNTARPIIDPVWHRVWARIEDRVAPIEARLSELNGRRGDVPESADDDARSWDQLAPHFLNAVGTVEAFGHSLRATRAETSELREQVRAEVNELREQVRAEVSEIRDDARSWDQLAPHFLNAVGTVEAFGHALRGTRAEVSEIQEQVRAEVSELSEQLRAEVSELREQVHQVQPAQDLTAVWDRIEFVRREVMFEQRYGRGAVSSSVESDNSIAARVVDTAKLEAMRNSGSGVRLNLGCGHIPLDGYLNVDRRDLPGVDVVATVDDLPFDPNTVTEISSAHLLEHFPEEMLRRNLLPYWYSLMRPGGCFRATVPDGQAMLSKVAVGEMSFGDFREVLFGAQDYDGDFHYNMFTPPSLTALLKEAGFHEIAVPAAGRRNGKCYEFEIVCQRP